MTPPVDTEASAQVLAWDGVLFQVPRGWDVSFYKFIHKLTSIDLEDDYNLRLQAQWTRPRRAPEMEQVRKAYRAKTKEIVKAASKTTEFANLPPGWSAFLYNMPSGNELLVAIYIDRADGLVAFFQIHFYPEDDDQPDHVLRLLCRTCTVQKGPLRRWEIYDLALEVPTEFELASTVFEAGRKHLQFRWRSRRLFYWQLSLADILLKQHSLPEYVADLLNRAKEIKGPQFFVGISTDVQHRKSRAFPFGHYEEWIRRCRRYRVHCRHDKEHNRIIVWCFNYRAKDDMRRLPKELFG